MMQTNAFLGFMNEQHGERTLVLNFNGLKPIPRYGEASSIVNLHLWASTLVNDFDCMD